MSREHLSGQSQSLVTSYPGDDKGVLCTLFSLKSPRMLLRVLRVISSSLYEGLEVSLDEKFLFTESYLRLCEPRNRTFLDRHQGEVDLFRRIFKNMERNPTAERWMLQYEGLHPELLSGSGLYGERGRLLQYTPKVVRRLRKAAPKAFIGRGYEDHGNCRNSALDGSPSWQSVASSPSAIYQVRRLSEQGRTVYQSEIVRKELEEVAECDSVKFFEILWSGLHDRQIVFVADYAGKPQEDWEGPVN